MNKTIFGLALAVAAAIPSFAQAPKSDNKVCTVDPDCAVVQCDSARKTRCAAAFEGITLTDAQKSKIKALRDNCRKEANCEAREARQACDSIKRAARAERRQDKINFLSGMKDILTPDQYVKFLENNFVNQPGPRDARFNKANRPGKNAKFARPDRKGDKDKMHKADKRAKN